MYFWSDIFKIRWDGFRSCTQKGVTCWPRTSPWIPYKTEGCGTFSRIERPNSWWPLKQWRMIRIVRISQNPLIVSASTSCTNPAVASLLYLSNILSSPCQCKSYFTSEEHSNLENSIWKADGFTTANSLENQKSSLLVWLAPVAAALCYLCGETEVVWQCTRQGHKQTCWYVITFVSPTGAIFNVVLRNLIKLSILCSFLTLS